MRKIAVKIRGIYTTALTKFLLDNGYAVVQPSLQIQERFLLPGNKIPEDILIQDREDHQGLFICGNIEQVAQLILLFRAHFFDMVVRRKVLNGIEGFIEKDLFNTYIRNKEQEEISLEVEFPGAAKAALDCLRAAITPTIRNHHLLKIIASDLVELVEEQLSRYPFRQKELEAELQEQVIYGPMKKKGFIEFYPDHIRYLDLHIDFIQRPRACPKIIDQEKLEKALSRGFISKELFQKSFEIAQSLIR